MATTFDNSLKSQSDAVSLRRQVIDGIDGADGSGDAESSALRPPDPWGLALSGGGIRSATYSLGVLQAIAEARRPIKPKEKAKATDPVAPSPAHQPDGQVFKESMLSRFDYLSTVSGGGYIGGFLTSLFLPGRLRGNDGSKENAADDVVKVLCAGPPGRIRGDADYTGEQRLKAPLAWLRDNGRYLLPTGSGDFFYALSIAIRNVIALHYVIATILLMLFFAMGAARTGLAQALLSQQGAGPAIDLVTRHLTLGSVRISPFALLSGLLVLLWAIPSGIAYWFAYPNGKDQCRPFNWAMLGALVCGAVTLGLSGLTFGAGTASFLGFHLGIDFNRPLGDLGARRLLLLTASVLIFIAMLMYAVASWPKRSPRSSTYPTAKRVALYKSASVVRVQLTHWLTAALSWSAALLLFALIDTLGRALFEQMASQGGTARVAALLGSIATFGIASAKLLAHLKPSRSKESTGSASAGNRLTTLAGLAGFLILFILAVLWSLFSYWAVPPGSPVRLHLLAFGASFFLAAVTGQFSGFINLSTLQPFYAGRITRAYLGASNGERFADINDKKKRSAAEPLPKDNPWLTDFLVAGGSPKDPPQLRTLAPLHIINLTINQTSNPAEQLVQRDRKGLPLAVTPFGFTYDNKGPRHFNPGVGWSEIERPLKLGQWIGLSGAAFSTGIGRETSLGMSLLMGAANVRLGSWWKSGAGQSQVSGLHAIVHSLFKTQLYLSYELTARFFGMSRDWQYLSDGGHFENTALYDLLRPGRGVKFIVACDCGADPDYRFDDLANLMRLVRIDLGVDVKVESILDSEVALKTVFGSPEEFLAARLGVGTDVKPDSTSAPKSVPSALLLRAKAMVPNRQNTTNINTGDTTTWIVLLKPMPGPKEPADVRQYAGRHPQFPQETTADQFFDEAQWESYRALGQSQAQRLFNADVWAELEKHCGVRLG